MPRSTCRLAAPEEGCTSCTGGMDSEVRGRVRVQDGVICDEDGYTYRAIIIRTSPTDPVGLRRT
jgi:hypothetical protein